jgi:DNA-binding beta-propeller fold protein YncE
MALSPWPWKNKGEPEPTALDRQNLNAAEEALAAQVTSGAIPLPSSVVSRRPMISHGVTLAYDCLYIDEFREALKIEPGEDETLAFRALITGLREGKYKNVGVVLNPNHYLNTAPQTNLQGNAVVGYPETTDTHCALEFIAAPGGTNFSSTLTGLSYSSSFGPPVLFGGPTTEQVGGPNLEFSAARFIRWNGVFTFVPQPNSSLGGWDFSRVQTYDIPWLNYISSILEEKGNTHTAVFGVRLAEGGNGGRCKVGMIFVLGSYVGIVGNSSHISADNLVTSETTLAFGITGNKQGAENANDGFSSAIRFLDTENSIYHIASWNPEAGVIPLPAEHPAQMVATLWTPQDAPAGAWSATKAHILDTNNMLSGHAPVGRVVAAVGPVSGELKKEGGANFSTPNIVGATPSFVKNTGEVSMSSSALSLGAISPATVTAGKQPAAVCVSPDEKNVYAVAFAAESAKYYVSQFDRNPSTGALTPLSTPKVEVGKEPEGICITPDGKTVYVTCFGANNIYVFKRKTGGEYVHGELEALGSPVATGSKPIGITANNSSVYVACFGEEGAKWNAWQYKREANGEIVSYTTPKVEAGGGARALCISEVTVKNLYIACQSGTKGKTVWGYKIEGSGELVKVQEIATGAACLGVAVSPDGLTVYAVEEGENKVCVLERKKAEEGKLAVKERVATGTGPWGVVVSEDNKTVYVTNNTSGTVSLYERNTGTGAIVAQAVPTVAAGSEPKGIAMAGNNSAYVCNYNLGASSVSQYSRKLSVEVADAGVTAESLIFMNAQDNNTVGVLRVSARTAGTGFTITSSVPADTGKVAWRRY